MKAKHVMTVGLALLVVACGRMPDRNKSGEARLDEEQKRADVGRPVDTKAIDRAGSKAPDARRFDQLDDPKMAALRDEQLSYMTKIDTELEAIDKQVQDLSTTAQSAAPKAKSDDQRALGAVKARRAALDDDLSSIQTTAPSGWGKLKTKTEADLRDLRTAVKTASTRIQRGPRTGR